MSSPGNIRAIVAGAMASRRATRRPIAFSRSCKTTMKWAIDPAANGSATCATSSGSSSPPATMLLSPYVPLLFMGEEYDEPAPFHYFVDHGDPALIASRARGRKREFARFWRRGRFCRSGGGGNVCRESPRFRRCARMAGTRCCGDFINDCSRSAASIRRFASRAATPPRCAGARRPAGDDAAPERRRRDLGAAQFRSPVGNAHRRASAARIANDRLMAQGI